MTYIQIALKYSLKHPIHFAKHMFESAPITWKIVRDDAWIESNGITYSNPSDMDVIRKQVYSKNEHPVGNYDNASLTNNGTLEFETLSSIVMFAKDDAIANTLMNSPALYMYLSIILLAALYIITRMKEIVLIYLPNLLNICVIFISTPAQQNRYLYPNYLAFYLLAIMLIGILMKGKSKSAPSPKDL